MKSPNWKLVFWGLIKDLRFTRIAYYWILFLAGIMVSGNDFLIILKTNWFEMLFLLISFALAVFSCIVTNNLADYQIDKISNPTRPHVIHLFAKRSYQNLGRWALLFALLIAAGVGWPYLLIYGAFVFNYYLYSVWPFRIKRFLLISKSVIALNSFLMILGGLVFSGRIPLALLHSVFWYCLIFGTLAANVIDLKDYQGDKAAGIQTLPVLLGETKAKFLISLFVFLIYAVFPFWFGINALQGFLILMGLFQAGFIILMPHHERIFFGLTYATFIFLGFYIQGC